MLETSTIGAGAVVGAAAGREDQGAVGELGFVAGGRAAPAGVPDPELVEPETADPTKSLAQARPDGLMSIAKPLEVLKGLALAINSSTFPLCD